MKLLEVGQKYSAARRIFNPLLSVSSADETLRLMLDILHKWDFFLPGRCLDLFPKPREWGEDVFFVRLCSIDDGATNIGTFQSVIYSSDCAKVWCMAIALKG